MLSPGSYCSHHESPAACPPWPPALWGCVSTPPVVQVQIHRRQSQRLHSPRWLTHSRSLCWNAAPYVFGGTFKKQFQKCCYSEPAKFCVSCKEMTFRWRSVRRPSGPSHSWDAKLQLLVGSEITIWPWRHLVSSCVPAEELRSFGGSVESQPVREELASGGQRQAAHLAED